MVPKPFTSPFCTHSFLADAAGRTAEVSWLDDADFDSELFHLHTGDFREGLAGKLGDVVGGV